MAYLCNLENGYQVFLDHQGTQTIITTSSSQPGQQQQASNIVDTGAWTAPPEAYRTSGGAVFKIVTAQGDLFIQVQGSSSSMLTGSPAPGRAQQMQMQQIATMPSPLMQPMQPMQPMQMGNMAMNLNPMTMRLGNMAMQMGSDSMSAPSQPSGARKFCSQCGVKVEPSDRFCSSCGHKLS